MLEATATTLTSMTAFEPFGTAGPVTRMSARRPDSGVSVGLRKGWVRVRVRVRVRVIGFKG